jgi:hypothetical protein
MADNVSLKSKSSIETTLESVMSSRPKPRRRSSADLLTEVVYRHDRGLNSQFGLSQFEYQKKAIELSKEWRHHTYGPTEERQGAKADIAFCESLKAVAKFVGVNDYGVEDGSLFRSRKDNLDVTPARVSRQLLEYLSQCGYDSAPTLEQMRVDVEDDGPHFHQLSLALWYVVDDRKKEREASRIEAQRKADGK